MLRITRTFIKIHQTIKMLFFAWLTCLLDLHEERSTYTNLAKTTNLIVVCDIALKLRQLKPQRHPKRVVSYLFLEYKISSSNLNNKENLLLTCILKSPKKVSCVCKYGILHLNYFNLSTNSYYKSCNRLSAFGLFQPTEETIITSFLPWTNWMIERLVFFVQFFLNSALKKHYIETECDCSCTKRKQNSKFLMNWIWINRKSYITFYKT